MNILLSAIGLLFLLVFIFGIFAILTFITGLLGLSVYNIYIGVFLGFLFGLATGFIVYENK